MLQKYEKLVSFYCLKRLYFGKGKGFFKDNKNMEVAIYCVPSYPLTDLEHKFTEE